MLRTLSISPGHTLIDEGGMDLGNITARKLNECRIPLIGGVGRDQNLYAGCFGLGKGIREVCDLIAGRLAPVGIRKVTIRYEHGQLAEGRFNPDSAIDVLRL